MCTGQAGAVQLGISRALDKFNSLLRPSLRAGQPSCFLPLTLSFLTLVVLAVL